jgi:hypothetical protein
MLNLFNLEQALLGFAALRDWSCPDCELGVRARQQFFDDHLGGHTFALLLPFVVVVGLSLALERVLR